MPLDVEIALINAIEGEELPYQFLQDTDIIWSSPPPDILPPFKYIRCQCCGPSSGYEIALKYGPHICRINVTAWGINYRKSTPTTNSMELVLIKKQAPYQMELIFL